MIETRRREALTAELRQAIEAANRNAEEDGRQLDPGYVSCVLEMLDRNDPSLDEHSDVCNCIAECGGSLEALKIAHELGYPWDRDTSCFAASNCSVDVMAYLHENGCPWDAWTFALAAMGGHLKTLKYLFDHGCPWDEDACTYAAENGHLQCLKYLHEHRCPWNRETIQAAHDAGHIDCLEYARAHGCPEDGEDDYYNEDQRELTASISDELPTVMAMIDEHSATLPEGAYVEMCGFLRKVHSLIRTLDHEAMHT